MSPLLDRRQLLRGATLGGALTMACPAWAQSGSPGTATPLPSVSGDDITLTIGHAMRRIDGRAAHAIGINGTSPAPLVRLREGQKARINVVNTLDEPSSIHWHGLLLPFQMDGVPGISFPGIAPRSSFTYEFPVIQSGTYWYHSHSGLQEQEGLYGPIVIDPREADPAAFDREHVIVLSDHSFRHPHVLFDRLKKEPGYFNRQRQTLAGLLAGRDQSEKERAMWGAMRMDPADIADVTGSTYTYLVNGHGPEDNWTALFTPGERVRLRFINASAMTTFNVRIPGLRMRIVAADGLNVQPVEIDEFQFGPAETYDAIVVPGDGNAYTLVGESIDRSGMARATLAPRIGMTAAVPPLRLRPLATMQDMGMDHGSMAGMDHGAMDHAAMGHAAPTPAAGHDMADMKMRDFSGAPQVRKGPGVQTISPMPVDRTGDPGQGLEDVDHRVLTYRDLVALERNPDTRAPDREVRLHLTGNMERYMWGFDGEKLSENPDPIALRHGERVRVTLINDTMMGHPIHLHGHFFELVTGKGDHAPRKHTVLVQPGGTVSWDVTAEEGDWAFHCHMLYHMHAGMMRVVQVRRDAEASA
ncbi:MULTISPECIES: copper resistance system multicopper oxidase [Sphingomonas]|nr:MULTISPECIES: copper resistance system multicopper oxidase [Sphingomonas]PZT91518.1 MAG: copper resistance system multicopper oxidase [Sphingomonas sp.]RSV24479.1 copper resistance system multicopper oxidase [Sphingomonas sp. ABOLH]WCP74002.1 copper resistance system multicopper oxidase [Sphingomonas hankookensis]